MWNNCTQYLHQVSQPSTPKSYEVPTLSPRPKFPPQVLDSLRQFPQPASPRYSYYANYAEGSPVYAFPYPAGNSWPLYQSPRGIGRRFGLVPPSPRSPMLRLAGAEGARSFGRMVETAAVLSPAAGRGLNVSSMSTTRGIKYGPVDEESSQKLERFKVRIVEIGEVVVSDEDKD